MVSQAVSCVKTDMTTGEVVDLVRMMGAEATVLSGAGPYEGDWDYWTCYPDSGDPAWLCYVPGLISREA